MVKLWNANFGDLEHFVSFLEIRILQILIFVLNLLEYLFYILYLLEYLNLLRYRFISNKNKILE